MGSDEESRQDEIEAAARERVESVSRLRQAAVALDSQPNLLAATRRLRRRLPGDERFGDPLSTAGETPVEFLARGMTAVQTDRESVLKELGLAGLQVWQSVSEAAGRGRGDTDMALLFTDLVGFSSWALEEGDTGALELLRQVGTAVEGAILEREGRVIKRLGDGLMASFLDAAAAVEAALDAQEALSGIEVSRYRPRMRAGLHWGRPRQIGGDYLGVDVNIAARVVDAAKADEVLISDAMLERIAAGRFEVSRPKRLRADGAPRELRIARVKRA